MAELIHDKIKRSQRAAEGLYHRLVLLVGETGSGKTGVLRDIANEFGSDIDTFERVTVVEKISKTGSYFVHGPKALDRWYVPDPSKANDLEKLREKALLKEFEECKAGRKKLKVFRLEAARAGFKKAWQESDYAAIVAVADKIPNNVLEDPKLLMRYDQAITRMGD